jgi:hypothetical protein
MRMPRTLQPTARTLAGRPFRTALEPVSPLAQPTAGLAPLAPLAASDQPLPGHRPVREALNTVGMPAERAARIAARVAFVEMKRSFIDAAARITGPHGETVRRKVRAANEPLELFHLREVVASLLPDTDADLRRQLRQKLLTVFSDTTTGTAREF